MFPKFNTLFIPLEANASCPINVKFGRFTFPVTSGSLPKHAAPNEVIVDNSDISNTKEGQFTKEFSPIELILVRFICERLLSPAKELYYKEVMFVKYLSSSNVVIFVLP